MDLQEMWLELSYGPKNFESIRNFIRSHTDPIAMIVGNNGSGKTRLLKLLVDHFINEGRTVVCISNSIHEFMARRRIPTRRERLHLHRMPRDSKRVIAKCFNAERRQFDRIREQLGVIFQYLKFSSRIGFRIFRRKLPLSDSNLSARKVEMDDGLELAVNLMLNESKKSFEGLIWLDLDSSVFDKEIFNALGLALANEDELRRRGIIKEIEIYVHKGDVVFPLSNSSSGELGILCMLLFIHAHITNGASIFIDEPENSLHPVWQREFIHVLADHFSYYNPKFFIASHSPIIASGMETHKEEVTYYHMKDFGVQKVDVSSNSIESTIYELFDIIPPRSQVFSNLCTQALNALADGVISVREFEKKLWDYRNICSDEKQWHAIEGILSLGNEIAKNAGTHAH